MFEKFIAPCGQDRLRNIVPCRAAPSNTLQNWHFRVI